MMKRILSALLIGLFLFSMVACGEEKNSKTNDEYITIDWSIIELADKIPTPESTTGEVIGSSEKKLLIYISETSPEDYRSYIQDCKTAGYTIDCLERSDSFRGYNADGYFIYATYEGDDSMRIDLRAPSENKNDKNDSNNESNDNYHDALDSNNNPATSDGVSADFKALMDSYEEFFDSYVAFMKKYKASTDQVSMMSDLADYMGKYSDMMAKLDAIDSKSLSDADAAYYAEVSARVMKKLAEVA